MTTPTSQPEPAGARRTTASEIIDVALDPGGHQIWGADSMRALVFGPDGPGAGSVILLDTAFACELCGVRAPLEVSADGVRATQPCPRPDNTTTITLAVPSGRIVVRDDLRPVFDVPDDAARAMLSYNTKAGQAQYIRAMAEAGCAYGPVGNTCPSLYRTGPDSYVIATPDYDDDGEAVTPPGWQELASICTNLWAYSIADHDRWVALGGPGHTKPRPPVVVDVAPGTYQFVHHTGAPDFDFSAPGPVIYAHITRIS